MPSVLTVGAHAKVNLTLEVLGVRSDGYHDLRSVVLPIPLHDDIVIEASDGVTVLMPVDAAASPRKTVDAAASPRKTVDAAASPRHEKSVNDACDNLASLPQEKNLAWKAAKALQRATGCTRGACITVVKRIPAGAGMGGGSSDAAAVLNGLNEFWDLHLPKARLCEIAAEVGSDVPALTLGGPVLMEGRGERVKPLADSELADFPIPDLSRLVVYTPPVFVSTPAVFREFREEDRGKGANDLQPAACRLHPEILQALRNLESDGCENVMMSGSGSTVFGWRRTE